ncbi:hypothetical protein [Gallaecimonas sp. GXIMD4217]|uniref:hypothetical protein n=1 Tax=Gallaecimonas sp. GXIMD4217 TaxID=3131927 RepID=UPI00311AC0CB
MKKSLLATLVALNLAACGGSSDSTPDNTTTPPPPPPAETALTGFFVDSPVAGIDYSTETHSGVTSPEGAYDYEEGETVTFSIGDLIFPAVAASGMVTPADIAAGDETTQTNILQILQSLDADGDPSNGISLIDGAADAFAGTSLDITSSDFDSQVTEVLSTLGDGIDLVSEEQAQAHFQQSLRQQLQGAWLLSEGDGMRNVLTFIDDEHYIIIHEHSDEPGTEGSQAAGSVEFGNYDWDPDTGNVELSLIGESDGWGGLYDGGPAVNTLAISGDTLTLGFVDGEVNFTRVSDADNPLIGSWAADDQEDDNILVLTFLSDSQYVIAHSNSPDAYQGQEVQPLAGEFGSYSYSGGELMVQGVTVDTDGPGGLFDGEEGPLRAELDLESWGEIVFYEDGDADFAMSRVGTFATTLVDDPNAGAEGELGTITTVRHFGGFQDLQLDGTLWQMDVTFAAVNQAECAVTFEDGSCGSTFEVQLLADGSGVIEDIHEDNPLPLEWRLSTAGTIEIDFSDGELGLHMVIAKLAYDDEQHHVLLGLYSDEGEEDSLWQTVMRPQ